MEFELEAIEKAITDLKEKDDLDADTAYIISKFRNAKVDEIVVLCTNHKFEEARECANRFNNAYLPDELKKVIDHLLWQINDYEEMLTGESYERSGGKIIRKKSKRPERKLKKAPKRKKKRYQGKR